MNDIKCNFIWGKFIGLLFLFPFIFCTINDEFNSQILESSDSYLIDINDYDNLGIIMTTSKKIYFISSIEETPSTSINFDLNVANYSMGATYHNNYLLVACTEDSLLGWVNIEAGESSPLLNYNDISYEGKTLDKPNQICSLSIFENIAYIAIAND